MKLTFLLISLVSSFVFLDDERLDSNRPNSSVNFNRPTSSVNSKRPSTFVNPAKLKPNYDYKVLCTKQNENTDSCKELKNIISNVAFFKRRGNLIKLFENLPELNQKAEELFEKVKKSTVEESLRGLKKAGDWLYQFLNYEEVNEIFDPEINNDESDYDNFFFFLDEINGNYGFKVDTLKVKSGKEKKYYVMVSK